MLVGTSEILLFFSKTSLKFDFFYSCFYVRHLGFCYMRTQQVVAVRKNRWHLLFLLLFKIIWKMTMGKFLCDQNIMAQLFRYFIPFYCRSNFGSDVKYGLYNNLYQNNGAEVGGIARSLACLTASNFLQVKTDVNSFVSATSYNKSLFLIRTLIHAVI